MLFYQVDTAFSLSSLQSPSWSLSFFLFPPLVLSLYPLIYFVRMSNIILAEIPPWTTLFYNFSKLSSLLPGIYSIWCYSFIYILFLWTRRLSLQERFFAEFSGIPIDKRPLGTPAEHICLTVLVESIHNRCGMHQTSFKF